VLDAGCNLYYVYYKRPRRQRSGRRCEIQPQKYDLRFVQQYCICIYKYVYTIHIWFNLDLTMGVLIFISEEKCSSRLIAIE